MQAAAERRRIAPAMPDIYVSILRWSESKLPRWQRDALRRIVTQASIGPDDDAELALMAKAEADIPVVCAPTPVPLAAEHVSQSQGASDGVTLVAMHGVRNVNALAPDQTLTFAEQGLTVVYGENGTGKSGYARVLRKACRARRAPEILADVTTDSHGSPEVAFRVKRGSAPPYEVQWSGDQPSPEELATFCVFDRECERSFVDDEGELAFVPPGLSVFEELAAVVSRVKQLLAEEEAHAWRRDESRDVHEELQAPEEPAFTNYDSA